jgi:hypothetical protein
MKGEKHLIKIGFLLPPPSEVDVGKEMKLQIQGCCFEGCSLLGKRIRILRDDGFLVHEAEFSHNNKETYITDEFIIRAPLHPGKYNWLIALPGEKSNNGEHAESRYPFTFQAVPHRLSLAVWDIPYPIVSSSPFFIKAGAKCSSNCFLAGQEIFFYNHQGELMGSSRLGDTPWPDSQSLFWCEMRLTAPPIEEYFVWEARLIPKSLDFAHSEGHFSFSFHTTSSAGKKITIQVFDSENKEPIENAFVTIGSYRGYTNAAGIINFSLPPKDYFFSVFKQGYEILEKIIKISENSSLTVELEPAIPLF